MARDDGRFEEVARFLNVYFAFRNYLPFEKGVTIHLNTHIPFTQEYFVPSLAEFDPVVSDGENVKSLQTDR